MLSAREVETIVISSDDSEEEEPPSSDDEDDYLDILKAFETCTFWTHLARRKQSIPRALPFLARNLRNGFLTACETASVATFPPTVPVHPVLITLRYHLHDPNASEDEDEDEGMWEERDGGEMSVWTCPVCDLHGTMNTREMVEFHLRHDHDELDVLWTQTVRLLGPSPPITHTSHVMIRMISGMSQLLRPLTRRPVKTGTTMMLRILGRASSH